MRALAAGLIVAGLLSVGLHSPGVLAAPLTGNLELGGRYTRSDGAGRSSESQGQNATLRLRKSTYVWQPWFAQVNAEVGLSLTRDSSRVEGESTRATSGEVVDGRLDLTLLPPSRFPLRLWLERRDSRFTDDRLIGSSRLDRTLTRYGLRQQYRSPTAGNYVFRLEETVVEQVDDATQRDERLSWSFTGQRRFERHDLGVQLDQDRTSSEPESRRTERSDLSLRHRYTPDMEGPGSITFNNLANANRRRTSTPQLQSRFDRNQLNSTAMWRNLGGRPLDFTANARLMETHSRGGDTASEQQLLALNTGVRYRLSDQWRFNANSGATLQQREHRDATGLTSEQSQVAHQHGAAVDFSSQVRTLAGFRHRWNADLSSNYRDGGDGEGAASGSLGVGQSLDRALASGDFGRLHGRANQSASHRVSSVDESGSSLQHGLALRWNRPLSEGSAFGELQFSDARQFNAGRQARVFQLANLQLSLQQQVSPAQSLSANATLQVSRSGDEAGFDHWQPSTSLGLVYRQQGLFGVQRLHWRSDLRYTSDNLLYLVRREDAFEEREQVRWENRLDYRIGMMSASVSATLTENDGVLDQAYRLTLSRRF
ncbi:hypothetical protein DU490_13005 [Halomonas sp. DQ26W]|uniref:hypothetical protein n=1 Tax=Halomonas sp. DQ26W TaxID=2282311 RepID=UPI000DF76112|nr:hypothetical protein [Halomonas sp. DQ26W]RDB42448.1 hypothetical protein DU490_13005 [Halomonas sp. DQ26W]